MMDLEIWGESLHCHPSTHALVRGKRYLRYETISSADANKVFDEGAGFPLAV